MDPALKSLELEVTNSANSGATAWDAWRHLKSPIIFFRLISGSRTTTLVSNHHFFKIHDVWTYHILELLYLNTHHRYPSFPPQGSVIHTPFFWPRSAAVLHRSLLEFLHGALLIHAMLHLRGELSRRHWCGRSTRKNAIQKSVKYGDVVSNGTGLWIAHEWWFLNTTYPLVICYIAMVQITMFNGKTHCFYGHFQ